MMIPKKKEKFICWDTLQKSDVPPNSKVPAMHVPYVNPKFYITDEILISNSILFGTLLFSVFSSRSGFPSLSYDFFVSLSLSRSLD
jgi:hypothetical protein